MNLPDPLLSRAVLIGSYSYRDLEPLPAVANNLSRLGQLFGSADLWGLPAQNCRVLPNPSGPAEVLDVIHAAAAEASDTLLVYYAGHGLVDPHTDDLYLALPESSLDRLYSAIRFEDIRRELVTVANSASKVVILDCCYSGRAMVGGMSGSMEMADQARIEGTYLMTASADTVKAQAPVGEQFTAFTNELVSVLDNGMPDGPDLLNVETIYWQVRKELVAKLRPTPQQRAGNDGGMIALARNRRGVRTVTRTARPQRPVPEPPPGAEAFMRFTPMQVAAEASRLTDLDRAAEGSQLLAAVAARRPDQEVAALLSVLRDQHRGSDADLVIGTVVRRPPEEISAVVYVLRQIGSAQDADQVLRVAAQGSPEDIGSTADVLAKRSRDADLRVMLDAAIQAHRSPEEVIALVGTLLSIGLGQEVGRLLDLAATDLDVAETAALADALRAAGRDDAAFRLYAGALPLIARRPPQEVASLLRAMRDAHRSEEADKLRGQIGALRLQPNELIAMTSALWASSLDEDSAGLLEAAAATLADEDIVALAELLRRVDRYEAALQLCVEAAAKHPVPVTGVLVQALRDAGRPIDAHHLLDSSRSWSPEKCAELLALLLGERNDGDAQRVLTAAHATHPDRVGKLIAALKANGAEQYVDQLIGIFVTKAPEEVSDLTSALLSQNLQAEAEALLAMAARSTIEYRTDLIAEFRRKDLNQCANYILRQHFQRNTDEVLANLRSLRADKRDDVADALLRDIAGFPTADVLSLIARFTDDNGPDARAIIAAAEGRSPEDAVAIMLAVQQRCPVDLDEILRKLARSPDAIIPLLWALRENLSAEFRDFMRFVVVASDSQQLCTLVVDLRRSRLDHIADELLGEAARRLQDDELLALRLTLMRSGAANDADLLLETALSSRPVAFMSKLVSDAGNLDSLWRGPRRTDATLTAIASIRDPAEVESFAQALKDFGLYPEMRKLRRFARERARQSVRRWP